MKSNNFLWDQSSFSKKLMRHHIILELGQGFYMVILFNFHMTKIRFHLIKLWIFVELYVLWEIFLPRIVVLTVMENLDRSNCFTICSHAAELSGILIDLTIQTYSRSFSLTILWMTLRSYTSFGNQILKHK